jgi:hypothetical protein
LGIQPKNATQFRNFNTCFFFFFFFFFLPSFLPFFLQASFILGGGVLLQNGSSSREKKDIFPLLYNNQDNETYTRIPKGHENMRELSRVSPSLSLSLSLSLVLRRSRPLFPSAPNLSLSPYTRCRTSRVPVV